VVVGDPGQKVVGYGTGKAKEVPAAIKKGIEAAKKRLKKARTQKQREAWEYKLKEAQFWLDAIRRDCFVVDVRLVGKSTSPSTIERQEAIQEVCKYVTKTTDLLQRPQQDLLGLLLPPRAPRVFDTFGACRGTWEQENALLDALRAAGEGAENRATALLDTAAIISGTPGAGDGPDGVKEEAETPQTASNPPPKKKRPPSWRKLMGVLPLSDFIRVMRLRAVSSSAFAMRRLQERGIWAWTVAEVLEMEDTFGYQVIYTGGSAVNPRRAQINMFAMNWLQVMVNFELCFQPADVSVAA